MVAFPGLVVPESDVLQHAAFIQAFRVHLQDGARVLTYFAERLPSGTVALTALLLRGGDLTCSEARPSATHNCLR